MRRKISLEPLTLPELGAPELIETAWAAGYAGVGLVLHSPHPSLPADPVVTDAKRRAQVREQLARTGVAMLNIECFNLTRQAYPDSFEAALACGYDLGAKTASAIVWENDDWADVVERFRRLCDMAGEHGIRVNVEFMPLSRSLPSLEAAVELVRACGRPNAGVMIDLLHLMRSGGSVAAVAALDPALIGGAQICDGPATVGEDDVLAEAGGDRAAPGEGEFPIRAFVDALPPTLVLGVEAPKVSLIGKVAPLERARRLMAATEAALSLAAVD